MSERSRRSRSRDRNARSYSNNVSQSLVLHLEITTHRSHTHRDDATATKNGPTDQLRSAGATTVVPYVFRAMRKMRTSFCPMIVGDEEKIVTCRILNPHLTKEMRPYFYFKICEEREDLGKI